MSRIFEREVGVAEEPKQQPGEETRAIIALSGVTEHAAKTRRWFVLGFGILGLLLVVVALDLVGFIQIPGIGLRGVVGLEPRATESDESSGANVPTTSAAERERMRRKLMGGGSSGGSGAAKSASTPTTDKGKLAAELFADDAKPEARVDLAAETAPAAAALPDGLKQEQIYEVITENSAAVSVCIGEAMRRGEKASGRMEMALTIAPTGRVSEVSVVTRKFQGSIIGGCIARRARNWKFPPFKGEPVTVVYPYVLDAAL